VFDVRLLHPLGGNGPPLGVQIANLVPCHADHFVRPYGGEDGQHERIDRYAVRNRHGEAFDVGETFAGVPYETGLAAVEEIRPLVPQGAPMAQFARDGS
jgi:hypothetical protein